MSEPFLGELKIVSFNFPPKGWALCNGQFLPIAQNQALFALLGTTYGGNGQTTFQLPDLRGRTPIHMSAGFDLGQKAGEEAHTLTIQEMPQHVHFAQASSTAATVDTPSSSTLLGGSAPNDLYTGAAGLVAMIPSTLTNFGGSQPHPNMQPYSVLNVIIALQGIFPSQN
jgi:microcystin-dependent protein